jgi:hypothetical protein
MSADPPYEDESFIEIKQLPAPGHGGAANSFIFIIQHKGSEIVYQAVARDRDELAAKIAAGEYEDVDPRNDRSPVDLDEDATDE